MSGGVLEEEAADLFSFDGGYVTYEEDSGHYFVAFTAVEIGDDDDLGHPAYAFEARDVANKQSETHRHTHTSCTQYANTDTHAHIDRRKRCG